MDALFDQVGLRGKQVLLEPSVMCASFSLSYVGARFEMCLCSSGIWQCRLHGSSMVVAAALTSVEALER
jgi:hypothetical protein